MHTSRAMYTGVATMDGMQWAYVRELCLGQIYTTQTPAFGKLFFFVFAGVIILLCYGSIKGDAESCAGWQRQWTSDIRVCVTCGT